MWRAKPHLWRWLLNVAVNAALLFAAAAVALWVRSHWATDWIYVGRGGVSAMVMTARNGCLLQWTGGNPDPRDRPLRWHRQSDDPSELVRGNWRFWTQCEPRQLLGVITWGRATYGFSGWGISLLMPYWLLACSAAASGAALLMILRRLHRGERRCRAGQCVRCGYDLRASKDRCPECGAVPQPRTPAAA